MKLFTLESGSRANPTIVFLHGGGAGGWMWQPQLDALAADFHCLAPDLPEQGRSLQAGTFTMAGAADQIADYIREQVPAGKAHVVGLSEGSQVAVALLSRQPEVVESAMICSALLRPIPMVSWMFTPAMAGLSYDLSVPPFKNADWWIRLNMKYAAAIPEAYFPQFKETFQGYTRDSFVHLMVENQSYRLPAGLEKAAAPALVTVGHKEYPQMIASARDLVKALPHATGRMVSLGQSSSLGQEHNWSLNAPELFTRTVRAWLSGQALPEELYPL